MPAGRESESGFDPAACLGSRSSLTLTGDPGISSHSTACTTSGVCDGSKYNQVLAFAGGDRNSFLASTQPLAATRLCMHSAHTSRRGRAGCRPFQAEKADSEVDTAPPPGKGSPPHHATPRPVQRSRPHSEVYREYTWREAVLSSPAHAALQGEISPGGLAS